MWGARWLDGQRISSEHESLAMDRVEEGTPRAYHSTTYLARSAKDVHAAHRHMVWVFGGFSDTARPMADLQCLNLATMRCAFGLFCTPL